MWKMNRSLKAHCSGMRAQRFPEQWGRKSRWDEGATMLVRASRHTSRNFSADLSLRPLSSIRLVLGSGGSNPLFGANFGKGYIDPTQTRKEVNTNDYVALVIASGVSNVDLGQIGNCILGWRSLARLASLGCHGRICLDSGLGRLGQAGVASLGKKALGFLGCDRLGAIDQIRCDRRHQLSLA